MISTLTINNIRTIDWSPDGSQLVYGGWYNLFEVKSRPTGDAGQDQTPPDSDSNGSEVVTLDGTASTDPDGTIVSYNWLENDTSIATGVISQVEFSVGIHTITLVVMDNDRLVVVITVH